MRLYWRTAAGHVNDSRRSEGEGLHEKSESGCMQDNESGVTNLPYGSSDGPMPTTGSDVAREMARGDTYISTRRRARVGTVRLDGLDGWV